MKISVHEFFDNLAFYSYIFETVSDTPSIIYGIEIQKTDFDVEQFATSCIVEYSEEGFNYHTALVSIFLKSVMIKKISHEHY